MGWHDGLEPLKKEEKNTEYHTTHLILPFGSDSTSDNPPKNSVRAVDESRQRGNERHAKR